MSETKQLDNVIYIYSDGAARMKYNVMAWSYVLKYNDKYKEDGRAITNATSNQMEMIGAIEALKQLKYKTIPIILTTDSEYVCKGLNDWSKYWITHEWKTSQNKKVKNIELWKELLLLMDSFENIKIIHCNGHNGVELNERCDQICNEKMDEHLQNRKGKICQDCEDKFKIKAKIINISKDHFTCNWCGQNGLTKEV